MALELFKSFLQQATATGTKSTALTDLRWFAGIIAAAFLVAIYADAETWIKVIFAVFLGLTLLAYIAAYFFFATRSPDALRSESFTLSKLAIEKSVKGDNLIGLVIEGESDRNAPPPPQIPGTK